MNYKRYYLSLYEWLRIIGEFLIGDIIAAYLFYDSFVAAVIGLAGLYPYVTYRKKGLAAKNRQRLKEEFQELIGVVSGKIRAGMSCENAFCDSLPDMEKMYGPDSMICREIKLISVRLNRRESLDSCLYDIGTRSGIDDIVDFAQVFSIAKSGSGRLREVIEDTVLMMREKGETESEIEVLIAGKKLEQKIMYIVPPIIIAYLKLEADDYMSILYHNPLGISVMSICLLLFIFSFFVAERVVNIEV